MKKNPNILMVDDEVEISKLVQDFLAIEDINVVIATSGEEALGLFNESVDLVVVDINMPGLSGIDLCKAIRNISFVPIVFLTCNNSQSDILLGLGVGADDYVTKPFNPIELVARIKANIRRSKTYSSGRVSDDLISFGDVLVYKNSYKVFKNNAEIHITPKEFELLLYLIENSYLVLTRSQILCHVWGDLFYDDNLVNTTIKRLRRRLEDNPEDPVYIKTIRGVGYSFQGVVK